MAAPPRPLPATRAYLRALEKRFGENLSTIAAACAKHEGSEVIVQRHVDEAFATLSRIGINVQPWYRRPELEIGAGGTIFGLAFACGDFFSGLFPGDAPWRAPVVQGIMVALIIVGASLAIHGWFRAGARV